MAQSGSERTIFSRGSISTTRTIPTIRPSPINSDSQRNPTTEKSPTPTACVGKLLDALRKHGLYDETMIAVMADHGESLGAHGENTHGVFLYDETLHVPLLIKLPAQPVRPGGVIESRAGLVDVAPTMLAPPASRHPSGDAGAILLESGKADATGETTRRRRPSRLRRDRLSSPRLWLERAARPAHREILFIQAPERELYDQPSDPGELHNLAGTSKGVTDTLASNSRIFAARPARPMVELDPEKMQKLQALGYVGSDTPSTVKMQKPTPIPKPNRNCQPAARRHVRRGRRALRAGHPASGASAGLQPDMPVAQMQYGIARPA